MDTSSHVLYAEEDAIIELNVGGTLMSTLKSTLTKETDSMLAAMVKGTTTVIKDSSGRFFIDCNPNIFCLVLDFLRLGLYPPHEKILQLYECAKHFGLRKLQDSLVDFKRVGDKKRAEYAKRTLDKEKYESLKQSIISKLAGSRKSEYICINILPKSGVVNATTDCPCNNLIHIGSKGQVLIYAEALKLPLTTDIDLSDDNLVTALDEDLYQLGYGRVRYSRHHLIYCNQCHMSPSHGYYLGILFSEKLDNNKASIQSSVWKFI